MPFSQSSDVVKALEQHGVEHDFDVREGQDHIFDKHESETMDRMYSFIKKQLDRTG